MTILINMTTNEYFYLFVVILKSLEDDDNGLLRGTSKAKTTF